MHSQRRLLSLIAILTSRFLLALQAANQQALGRNIADADEHGDRGHGSTLHFASAVLGSISASIPVRRGTSALDGEEGEGAGDEGADDLGDRDRSGEREDDPQPRAAARRAAVIVRRRHRMLLPVAAPIIYQRMIIRLCVG